MNKALLYLTLAFIICSCTTYKNINYLQDVEAGYSESIKVSEGIVIQPKDMLSIIVSSKNPELAVIFNLPVVSYQAGSEMSVSGSSQRLVGYVVDNNGDIDFPTLGKVKVAGLTRWQLSEKIKSELITRDYIKDPIVTVQFMNFKVSIMGEVTSPGTYTIESDRISLLEALSLAKDLTIYGKRDNVKIIREKDGYRNIYNVDLRSKDLFLSPAYYLQQNDIVYVEPNSVRAGQSTSGENVLKSPSFWVSIASVLTSISVLIFR